MRQWAAYLVYLLCLLLLDFQNLFYAVLDNFPTFLHTTGKGRQWLFELCPHLSSVILVLLGHSLDLPTDGIQRCLERARFLGPE